MNYLAISISIGLSEGRSIEANRIGFHNALVRLLFPNEQDWCRLGNAFSSPLTHREDLTRTARVGEILADSLRRARATGRSVDVTVFDFSGNMSVRDPLLVSLAAYIGEACEKGLCSRYVVCLPTPISKESASWQQFDRTVTNMRRKELAIMLLPNSGDLALLSASPYDLPNLRDAYRKVIAETRESPSARLEKRCVRRLGHFKDLEMPSGRKKCRQYSYGMYECENELFELLRGWWDSQATDARNIVFDLRNNASFKNAVKAFGTRRAIPTARIDDVIRNSELQRALKGVGSSTLVLDVVNTGSTLEKHARALERLGMSVSKHALAAINKGGSTHTKVKDFDVWAFLCRPHDGVTEPCVQCALDLPQTDESAEAFGHLRAFDYLQMAEAAGWEVEPDAPVSVGQQYRMVPNFSRVLELYGDYIAYRLYLALRQWNFPADWFVVHPKEPDSTALSEALQIPLDRPLTIVRVPRKSIEAAQGIGNAWERVLEQEEEDRSWIEQLTALSGDTERGALILDIFNGSGSTFRSLESLLYHMRIQIVGYVCLGDFDPEGSRTGAIQLPKYALYEMHNPRVMHQKPTR